MSVLKTSVVLAVNLLVLIQFGQCTEFIPVYMWSTGNINKRVPALHRITQDSFRDDILEDLKDDTFVVVFAEHTLSPEDFAVRDGSGHAAFPYLSKLRKEFKTTYLPYVQNPIKGLKHLNKDVTEVSIEKLRQNVEVPNTNILIVDLNDAHDDEQRFNFLKRHDSEIIPIYNEIVKSKKNVLALYTAHHTSWVGSEEIIESRKTRSLLQAADPEDTTNKYFKDPVYVYMSGDATFTEGTRVTNVSLTFSANKSNDIITLIGTGTDLHVEFVIANTTSGYWEMRTVTITGQNTSTTFKTNTTIYAPLTYSYACGDQLFQNATLSLSLYLPRFQIQPLYKTKNDTKFDDPYNCVGFTSVPIWSGIFVTFILMLIMTFGLTMIMDIKTMDRFDDAKGKTITINVSE